MGSAPQYLAQRTISIRHSHAIPEDVRGYASGLQHVMKRFGALSISSNSPPSLKPLSSFAIVPVPSQHVNVHSQTCVHVKAQNVPI